MVSEPKFDYILQFSLTYSFPMHLLSTPYKHQKTLRFSDVEGRERVHWKQMG